MNPADDIKHFLVTRDVARDETIVVALGADYEAAQHACQEAWQKARERRELDVGATQRRLSGDDQADALQLLRAEVARRVAASVGDSIGICLANDLVAVRARSRAPVSDRVFVLVGGSAWGSPPTPYRPSDEVEERIRATSRQPRGCEKCSGRRSLSPRREAPARVRLRAFHKVQQVTTMKNAESASAPVPVYVRTCTAQPER
jgi:hypothetical protein